MKNNSIQLRRPFLTGCLVLGAVLFSLYSVSLGHNFLFDEENIVLSNPNIKSLKNLPQLLTSPYFYADGKYDLTTHGYYRPLVLLTFVADHQIWKLNPFGYNLTNLLLQLAVALTLYVFLRELLKNEAAAFTAALLYSVHTIHTEAVTYIASRGDIMGGLFVALSLLFYHRGRWKTSLALFVPALLCKESSLFLPVYAWALDLALVRTRPKRLAGRLAAFAAVAAAYVVLRKFVVPLAVTGVAPKESLLRFFSMGPPFLSYLEALVYPARFKFSLPVHFAKHFSDPVVFLSLFIFALMLGTWLWALKRRGPAFFGLSVFLAGFAPYMHIAPFYPEWAEHYLYIPAMGLAVLAGVLFRAAFTSRVKTIAVLTALAAATFAIFVSTRTFERNRIYNDQKEYYAELAMTDSLYAAFGYMNLGRIATREKDEKLAGVYFRTAVDILPGSCVSHHLLANYHVGRKHYEEAVKEFEAAHALHARDKLHSNHLISWANTLMLMERYDEAIVKLREAESMAARNSIVHIRLSQANELAGRSAQAFAAADEGLKETSAHPTEFAPMAIAAARMAYREGMDDKALEYAERAYGDTSRVFWHTDVAKLLTGRMTKRQFLEMAESQGEDSYKWALDYVLLSLVLRGEKKEAAAFLAEHRETFDKEAEKSPLFKKELERAVRFVV